MAEGKHTEGPLDTDAHAQVRDLMPEIAQLKAENKELLEALEGLANAADEVGVNHFDTDTMDADVKAMQTATSEARTAIKRARGEDGG